MTILFLAFQPQKPNKWMAIIWHHLSFLLLADSLLLNSKALGYRPYVLFTFVCLQLSLSPVHNRCSITICWTELSFSKTSLCNWQMISLYSTKIFSILISLNQYHTIHNSACSSIRPENVDEHSSSGIPHFFFWTNFLTISLMESNYPILW